MIMNSNQQRKGISLAISGAALWGVSGVASQLLFNRFGVAPVWLVGLRLLIGGGLALLLALCNPSIRADVWSIWQIKQSRRQLLLFSFFGFFPSQLSFFMAINYGNVATAAALQFLSPAFTVLYFLFLTHALPSRVELITVGISIVGTLLLITNGNFTMLVVTPLAIGWGLLSGIGQVAYSILPKPLLNQYDPRVVVGWGMFLGGLPLFPKVAFTSLPTLNLIGVGAILVVVLAGTLVACLCYISSLQYIVPAVAQMLGSFEPLTATVVSIIGLHQAFGGFELLGMGLIISVVFIQARWHE